jgi:hypothetical protein
MVRGWTARLAVLLCGAAAVAVVAAGAGASPDRAGECNAVAHGANVCYGTLPPLRRQVMLTSRNGARDHGVASITFGIHDTLVSLKLKGAPKGVRRTAFIRLGGCWGRSVAFPLGNVTHGRRVVRVGIMPRDTGVAIVVRTLHAATAGAVVACGVIPSG